MIFSDITGQESTVKALSNAIETGRIMHAYLFCGPRGTGKTSSARIFAKSLNCENGPTVKPCGKCPGCLDVINSTPVDVIEIDAASNRSVEDARNILEKVQYAPVHGKYKIYIIDEVHMLTTEASNTLLKTLEEPPENVIFILATTESHKVLETIVSRCQRYDFKRITTSDIVKRLDFIAKSEKIKIDEAALTAVAKNAAGGMRDAVALLDQLSVLGQDRNITVEDVNEILGQISYEAVFDIAECILNADCGKVLQILNSVHDRGNEPSRILTTLIQYFRDELILKSCTDKNFVLSSTKINENIYEKISKQAEIFDTQTLIYYIDRITYHLTKQKESNNKYMWAELCLIELVGTPKIPTLAELAEKVKILEEKITSGISYDSVQDVKTIYPVKEIKTETVKKEDIIPQNTQEIKKETPIVKETQTSNNSAQDSDAWEGIVKAIIQAKAPAGMFFSNLANPVEITKESIVLAFTNEMAVKQAEDDSKKIPLKNAALQYFGVNDINIKIIKGTDSIKKKIIDSQNKQENFTPKNENVSEKLPANIEKNEKIAEKKEIIEKVSENEESIKNNSETDTNKEEISIKNNEYLDISDTSRMIIDLFGGKIVD